MRNLPKEIWLNVGVDQNEEDLSEVDFNQLSEVTWSKERIYDQDIRYVRIENGCYRVGFKYLFSKDNKVHYEKVFAPDINSAVNVVFFRHKDIKWVRIEPCKNR